MEVFGVLCTEPWCWEPRAVSALTDWQVWNLVIHPAVKRAERLDKGSKGGKKQKSRMPTREEYVMIGRQFGYSEDRLNAEYDKAMGGKA